MLYWGQVKSWGLVLFHSKLFLLSPLPIKSNPRKGDLNARQGHNSPGGHKRCGQSVVGLTALPRVGLISLCELGLSTLSHLNSPHALVEYSALPDLNLFDKSLRY